MDFVIVGNGFFIVFENVGEINYEKYFLMCVGLFLLDENGDLVNVVGYYFVGFLYDLDGNLQVVDCSFFVLMEMVNVGKLFLFVLVMQIVFVLGNFFS